MSAASAVARRTLRDGRARNLSFALFFALEAYVQPTAYRHAYPTLKDRLGFAHSFGANKALRLFYGTPHDLVTVGGYSTWRVAGLMSIVAASWGLLAAVRALRTEEDAGRQELVLSGIVGRRAAFLAALSAIGLGAALLWVAVYAGLVAGRLPAGSSAVLALATVSPALVFVGVGALASQLAPSRRIALEIGAVALVIALLLRVVADTATRLDWLRWATPLGWVEELRPFARPAPEVLMLALLSGAALLTTAGLIAARRDIGTGLLRAADSAEPDFRLLSSPTAQALRSERGSLIGWLVGIGFFALIMGFLSHSFSSTSISTNLQRQLEKLGGASITTPAGALGFYFLFFILTIGLFACSQVAAARHEESDQRLETLFALPVARRRWLTGRLLLAAGAATALAIAAGVLAWVGAASQGGGVSLDRLLEAGVNCLPADLLFLSLGALAFAVLPRASAGIAYGVVSVAFVWELVGGLLGAPSWVLGLSPFHHVGLVPAQPFKVTAAIAMLLIAVAVSVASISIFERRDLIGA